MSGWPRTLCYVTFELDDPLAHRALDALAAAETSVMGQVRLQVERFGLSTTGFAILVLLTSADGSLEMRTVRLRLRASKATVSEVVSTLESRNLVIRQRIPTNRRAAMLMLTGEGRALVNQIFPQHSTRVKDAFSQLDEDEKRTLTSLCRKLAA